MMELKRYDGSDPVLAARPDSDDDFVRVGDLRKAAQEFLKYQVHPESEDAINNFIGDVLGD